MHCIDEVYIVQGLKWLLISSLFETSTNMNGTHGQVRPLAPLEVFFHLKIRLTQSDCVFYGSARGTCCEKDENQSLDLEHIILTR